MTKDERVADYRAKLRMVVALKLDFERELELELGGGEEDEHVTSDDLDGLAAIDEALDQVGRQIANASHPGGPDNYMALCRERQKLQRERREYIETRGRLQRHLVREYSRTVASGTLREYRWLKQVERELTQRLAKVGP